MYPTLHVHVHRFTQKKLFKCVRTPNHQAACKSAEPVMKPILQFSQVLYTLQQERENCIAALRHQNDAETALVYKQQLDAAIACLQ